MFVLGSPHLAERRAKAAHASPVDAAWRAAVRQARSSPTPPQGRRFELALPVAALPEAARNECLERLLPLSDTRPAWTEEDIGNKPAERCRCWWPFAEERLAQQTPRSLLRTVATEREGSLRRAATPLWLSNPLVRRVGLLRQGRRVGQAQRELERQLGDAALACAWVRQKPPRLVRTAVPGGQRGVGRGDDTRRAP